MKELNSITTNKNIYALILPSKDEIIVKREKHQCRIYRDSIWNNWHQAGHALRITTDNYKYKYIGLGRGFSASQINKLKYFAETL